MAVRILFRRQIPLKISILKLMGITTPLIRVNQATSINLFKHPLKARLQLGFLAMGIHSMGGMSVTNTTEETE